MQANKTLKVIGLIILVALISLVTEKIFSSSATTSGNSVYNKVVSSGTIRSCYIVYPPALIKDPNTGKLSGIFYDTLNKAAENMGLKVDWSTEVGWGDAIEALNSGKCDVVGSDAWSNSTRGKSAEFIQPLYYSAINAYVRADDNRFDNNISIANNSNFKLVTVDGETSQVIAKQKFPNAKTVQLPQLTDVSQLFVNVVSGKGDITFQEASTASLYSKNNPGKIKSVSDPIVIYGNVMMVKKGEFSMKTMLDNSIIELLGTGYVDGLIDQYEKEYPGGFYRVTKPYVTAK